MPQTQKQINDATEVALVDIQGRLHKLEKLPRLSTVANGATLEVDFQTRRQMSAEAQSLGLRSADELTQIVLHAFLEMVKDDPTVHFPLMLEQVE